MTSGQGIPLSIVVTAANVNDQSVLAPLLDARVMKVPADALAEGLHLCLDGGYNYQPCFDAAAERELKVHIQAKPGKEATPLEGVERYPARRWVVEVCHSWLNRFRRILVRWEKKLSNYLGFLHLAIGLVIYRKICKLGGLSG